MLIERLDQTHLRTFERVGCDKMLRSQYFPKLKPWKCKLKANWIVDGVSLCTRHAGELALIHMAGAKDAD